LTRGQFLDRIFATEEERAIFMNTERIAFLILLIVSLYGLISSSQMPLGQLQEPGAGFFPLTLSIILFSLAGLGFVLPNRSKAVFPFRISFLGDLGMPVKIFLSTAMAIFFFESAGFLAIGVLFLTLLFFWVSGYRFWKALIFGIAGGMAGWFLFVKLLGVSMPGGILGI
jgi:putative tricarboxylic transport membrane protein